ncbi:hypothetical protein GCM10017559_43330 [Streptosporangium longisporum]|uniref:Fibronectin type-III domain-containing protein n=1 Tax=Streptosporangium longisporum TaxID=46187 RepID=A0ABN3Y2B7_9ACTN
MGVSGYDVYREAGATDVKVATASSASHVLSGLSADTAYTFYVIARRRGRQQLHRLGAVTFTTAAGQGGGCTATYKVANSWPGGFQGEVTVKTPAPRRPPAGPSPGRSRTARRSASSGAACTPRPVPPSR